MTTENENIVNATNLGAILEGLKNVDRSTLTEEQNLEVDQTLVTMGGEISSERKSQIKKNEDAKVLERWNYFAEKTEFSRRWIKRLGIWQMTCLSGSQ